MSSHLHHETGLIHSSDLYGTDLGAVDHEAEQKLAEIQFIDPKRFGGVYTFEDIAEANAYMSNNKRVALTNTTPDQVGFRPEKYARKIIRYDEKEDGYVSDGDLRTELAEPFMGDSILQHSGSVILLDSTQKIGIELHPSDALLLYDGDSSVHLDDELQSERLKSSIKSGEKRHSHTNDLFYTKRLGRVMLRDLLTREKEEEHSVV